MRLLLAAILAVPFLATGTQVPEKPVIEDRLLPADCWGERPAGSVVDMAVIHFSSAAGVNKDNPYDPTAVIEIFKKAKVSAHFLIDREGNIYRLVLEKDRAFHAGKGEMPREPKRKDVLNNTSIGIELIGMGTYEETRSILGESFSQETYDQIAKKHGVGFTDNQYKSLKALIDHVRGSASGKGIAFDRCHIIGHSEYSRPGTRPDPKSDPGSLFDWKRIGLEKKCDQQ